MGGITIKNPGSGDQARVTNRGQLFSQAEQLQLQHFVSRYDGQAYQAQFFDTGIGSGTNNVGFIRNNSTTLKMAVSYIRLQAMDLSGGTAVPSADNYWTLNHGESYGSGGSLITPVNSNRNSGNVADVTAYDTNPTLSGTVTEFDRLYIKDEGQYSFNKEGAVILGTNDALTLKLVTNNSSGVGYCRVTFMMMNLDDFN